MKKLYNRNENMFVLINIGIGIVTFVLYSLQDTTGIMLLFLPILLVNAVVTLSAYQVIQKLNKCDIVLSDWVKLCTTMFVNSATYIFIFMYFYNLYLYR